MLAGQQLDLVRPRKIRQQFTDFDGIGGKRRDRGVNKCNAILAHWSEADCIRWNRYRMTVLHPEHYSLARRGSGKTGIPIGRPGVGVMRGGQRTAARFFGQSSFVEYIERVFDHIVPGGTHDVQKQLATKSVELNRSRISRLSRMIVLARGSPRSHHSARTLPSPANSVSQQVI